MQTDEIREVRRFNRLYTQRIGVLSENYLGRGRSVGASRVLFEVGPDGADVRELRARLGLDSGYLSRLLSAMAAEGLVRVRPLPRDRRVRRAELTAKGLEEYREMDRRSDAIVETMLASLGEAQRAQVVQALSAAGRLLRLAALQIERVPPGDIRAGQCLAQYYAELDRRFEGGFDVGSSLPMEEAELVPPRGAFLVASIDGVPVACGALKTIGPETGYLKRMWVAPGERGLGLGRRMLAGLEAQARALGFTRLCLETNRALTEAIALYRASGYVEVPPFNDEPYAHHWFERALS